MRPPDARKGFGASLAADVWSEEIDAQDSPPTSRRQFGDRGPVRRIAELRAVAYILATRVAPAQAPAHWRGGS
jgi:hypothetical protein